jgi:hypothetical protein
MKHKMRYGFVIMGFLLIGSMVASLGGNQAENYPYPQAVQVAMQWIGANTPTGSLSIAVNEQLFSSMNATYPGHDVVYKPFDSESPVTASYDAVYRSATYLIVTDLQGEGYSAAENYAWNQFTGQNLNGAALVYSNDYVHVFEVIVI